LPIRFSELANTPHSPVANAKANALALPFAKANGKWRMKDECGVFADFNAKAKWQKCQYNDAHCQYLSLKKLKC
jgi:hypothetical protein